MCALLTCGRNNEIGYKQAEINDSQQAREELFLVTVTFELHTFVAFNDISVVIMPKEHIQYSDKYTDDKYEYR